MSDETDDLEVVLGSGNVFRDVGLANPDAEQLKSILAARIIGVMDARKLSTRKGEGLTGITAADFSRIRNGRLDRFTIDRLIAILGRLDQKVDVVVSVSTRETAGSSLVS